MYRIEMWSFAVGATAGAARHNFLVQVDSNGNAVKEMHGGAREVVNGVATNNLEVTALSGTAFVKEGIVGATGTYGVNPVASTGPNAEPTARREAVLHEGTQSDVDNRWGAMNLARVDINAQERPYLPSPTDLNNSINSNAIAGTLARTGTDVTYENAPSDYSAPGSRLVALTQEQQNTIRTARSIEARDGTEDKITHETLPTDPETGRSLNQYTLTTSTGEVKESWINTSTIDPATGLRSTPTGVAEVQRDTYENNPATPGNPLETRTTLDPLDIRPEVTRTTQYAPDGTPTGVVNNYDDAANWRASHALNDAHLARFDEAAVNALSQQIERSAYHGGATPDSTPYVLSYEPQFNTGYDFNAGNYDVDAGLPFRRNQSYNGAAAMVCECGRRGLRL
jgi:hypothetical protein